MPVWEIVNPSDPYTISHDRFAACAAAAMIIGEGRYALRPVDEGEQEMPLFLFGGHEAFIDEHFGGDFSKWMADPSNRRDVIDALDSVLLGGPGRRSDYDAAVQAIDDPEKLSAFRSAWQDKRSSLNDIGGYAHGLAAQMREQDSWVSSRQWKGLPLTIDEAVSRYLREIADGPDCASYLRDCDWPGDGSNAKGFDSWLAMWRWSHGRNESDGVKSEWDSRDYTDDEMRMIYDDIIQHTNRGASS